MLSLKRVLLFVIWILVIGYMQIWVNKIIFGLLLSIFSLSFNYQPASLRCFFISSILSQKVFIDTVHRCKVIKNSNYGRVCGNISVLLITLQSRKNKQNHAHNHRTNLSRKRRLEQLHWEDSCQSLHLRGHRPFLDRWQAAPRTVCNSFRTEHAVGCPPSKKRWMEKTKKLYIMQMQKLSKLNQN